MDNRNYMAAVVDMETTGLSANKDVPLEVGIKIVDKEGFVYNEASWLVYEANQHYDERIRIAKAHGIVGPMHESSGLWADIDEVARGREVGFSRREVDEDICDWLTENNVTPTSLPMMGSSIGSLDRPFALVHFPRFNAALSHRNIDISSVKELCKANNPTLFENLKSILGSKEDAKHRVLDDIDACILEYRAYRENFFFLED